MTQAAHRLVSGLQRGRAKSLRREMTNAEQKLWRALRGHRFQNISFRRQSPIGPFIVDFVCHKHRLIIEIDGGQHTKTVCQDAQRDAWLASKGYRILRFWNSDVLHNMQGVLETILSATSNDLPPSLTLPLKGGGNKGIVSLQMCNSSTAPVPYLPSRAEERDTHNASPLEGEADPHQADREGGMAQHTASSKKARPGDGKK